MQIFLTYTLKFNNWNSLENPFIHIFSTNGNINLKTLTTFVYDHFLQFSFPRSSLYYFLIDSIGCDKSVHHDWLSLTNSVTSILGLKITLWILECKGWTNLELLHFKSSCVLQCCFHLIINTQTSKKIFFASNRLLPTHIPNRNWIIPELQQIWPNHDLIKPTELYGHAKHIVMPRYLGHVYLFVGIVTSQ